MEVKLDLTRELADAKKEAEALLRDRVSKAGRRYADSLLRDNGYFGMPSGVLFDMLKEKVDSYVTSDAFDKIVEKVIAEVAEEQTREALKALLNSAARKQFFQPTSPVDAERGK